MRSAGRTIDPHSKSPDLFASLEGENKSGSGGFHGKPGSGQLLDSLKMILGMMVMDHFKDQSKSLDLDAIFPKNFSDFVDNFLIAQSATDDGKNFSSAYRDLLYEAKFKPLLEYVYSQIKPDSRNLHKPEDLRELFLEFQARVISASGENAARHLMSTKAGRGYLENGIWNEEKYYNGKLPNEERKELYLNMRANLARGIAEISAGSVSDVICEQVFNRLSLLPGFIITWNPFNWSLDENKLIEAEGFARIIFNQRKIQKQSCTEIEKKSLSPKENIQTKLTSRYDSTVAGKEKRGVNDCRKLLEEKRAAFDAKSDIQKGIAKFYLFVANSENWKEGSYKREETSFVRRQILSRLGSYLKKLGSVTSEEALLKIIPEILIYLEGGFVFNPKTKVPKPIAAIYGHLKLDQFLKDLLPDEKESYQNAIKILKECRAANKGELSLKTKSPELKMGMQKREKKTLEKIAILLQGLEKSQRELWYRFYSLQAVSRGLTQVAQLVNQEAGNRRAVERAIQQIDWLINQLVISPTEKNLGVVAKKLYKLCSEGGAILEAMGETEQDGIEGLVGLAESTLLMIPAGLVVGVGASLLGRLVYLAKKGSQIQKTVVFQKVARVTKGFAIGALVSLEGNALSVTSGQIRQGRERVWQWLKEAIATGFGMAFTAGVIRNAPLKLPTPSTIRGWHRAFVKESLKENTKMTARALWRLAKDMGLEINEEVFDHFMNNALDGKKINQMSWAQFREIAIISAMGGFANPEILNFIISNREVNATEERPTPLAGEAKIKQVTEAPPPEYTLKGHEGSGSYYEVREESDLATVARQILEEESAISGGRIVLDTTGWSHHTVLSQGIQWELLRLAGLFGMKIAVQGRDGTLEFEPNIQRAGLERKGGEDKVGVGSEAIWLAPAESEVQPWKIPDNNRKLTKAELLERGFENPVHVYAVCDGELAIIEAAQVLQSEAAQEKLSQNELLATLAYTHARGELALAVNMVRDLGVPLAHVRLVLWHNKLRAVPYEDYAKFDEKLELLLMALDSLGLRKRHRYWEALYRLAHDLYFQISSIEYLNIFITALEKAKEFGISKRKIAKAMPLILAGKNKKEVMQTLAAKNEPADLKVAQPVKEVSYPVDFDPLALPVDQLLELDWIKKDDGTFGGGLPLYEKTLQVGNATYVLQKRDQGLQREGLPSQPTHVWLSIGSTQSGIPDIKIHASLLMVNGILYIHEIQCDDFREFGQQGQQIYKDWQAFVIKALEGYGRGLGAKKMALNTLNGLVASEGILHGASVKNLLDVYLLTPEEMGFKLEESKGIEWENQRLNVTMQHANRHYWVREIEDIGEPSPVGQKGKSGPPRFFGRKNVEQLSVEMNGPDVEAGKIALGMVLKEDVHEEVSKMIDTWPVEYQLVFYRYITSWSLSDENRAPVGALLLRVEIQHIHDWISSFEAPIEQGSGWRRQVSTIQDVINFQKNFQGDQQGHIELTIRSMSHGASEYEGEKIKISKMALEKAKQWAAQHTGDFTYEAHGEFIAEERDGVFTVFDFVPIASVNADAWILEKYRGSEHSVTANDVNRPALVSQMIADAGEPALIHPYAHREDVKRLTWHSHPKEGEGVLSGYAKADRPSRGDVSNKNQQPKFLYSPDGGWFIYLGRDDAPDNYAELSTEELEEKGFFQKF